ncbi:hypothetical protein ACFY1L_37255 [Streptomyces sp. NPDC001663]|uniref:hypothetical protein n=1 Tax=Streptomyces sp. NPDC001663 TaxID=3364597 RepID=UPI00368AD7F1
MQDPEPSRADTSISVGRAPVRDVLVLRLPAVAAIAFLLLGFTLRHFDGRPYVGEGLITVGLIAGAMAVGTAVGDLAWVYVTAARRCSGADDGAAEDGR